MGATMDKPFQTAMTVMLLVVLLEVVGVILYLSGRAWGLIMTTAVVGIVQTMTLILVWYTLKLSFHMGREIVTQAKPTTVVPENKQN